MDGSYESIEYAVVDNETCFYSLWVLETGVLRSVVQSFGLRVKVWTGFIGLRMWTRGVVIVNIGTAAVGAMKFEDSSIVALRLTMFGTLVTNVPRIWELYFSLATHNSD